MKVISKNPVVINNERVSQPSKYLAMDGGEDDYEQYFNFNAGNTEEVKAFQDWMDLTYPTWYGGKPLNKGRGYGRMTRKTKRAARDKGRQFDKLVASGGSRAYLGKINPITGEFEPPAGYSTTSPTGETRKGQFWNKVQGGWEKTGTALNKAQNFLNTLQGVFGTVDGMRNQIQPDFDQNNPNWDNRPPVTEDRGMSRGAKIALIGGGVVVAVVLGVIIYKVATKDKGGKGKKGKK